MHDLINVKHFDLKTAIYKKPEGFVVFRTKYPMPKKPNAPTCPKYTPIYPTVIVVQKHI